MHLLPLNLGVLADHTGDSARVSVGGVHLELSEGRYTATATDCKQIISVSGPVVGDAAEYPELPGLRDAPDGATTANIPAKMFKAFFATAKKKTLKRTTRPELKSVAVKLSPHGATLACTDLDAGIVECTLQVEGRFPPIDQIFPTKKPTMVFTVDPAYVAQMAKSLATFADDPTDAEMVVEITDAGRPILFKVERKDGTVARGLVMPFCEPGDKKTKAVALEADAPTKVEVAVVDPTASAEVERLNRVLEQLKLQLDFMTSERNRYCEDLHAVRKQGEYDAAAANAYMVERDTALDKVEKLEAELVYGAKKPAKKGRTKKAKVAHGDDDYEPCHSDERPMTDGMAD